MKDAAGMRKRYDLIRTDMIEEIQNALENLPKHSLDLSQTSGSCVLDAIDDQESVVAMGLKMDSKKRITVYGGIYDVDNTYSIHDLWTDQLLDLYENVEEAIKDGAEPFEED